MAPRLIALTGVEASAEIDNATPGFEVSLSGEAATGNAGSVSASLPGAVGLIGVAGTAAAGDMGGECLVALTGVEAVAGAGNVAVQSIIEVALAGVGAVTNAGSVVGHHTLALAGSAAVGAIGSMVVAGTEIAGATVYVGEQVLINRSDTSAPLDLAVNDDGGVTGLTVTVEIRDASTTNSYLDFDDLTFKTSSWTQKGLALADLGNGHYRGTLNVAGITNLPSGSHLVLEYDIQGTVTAIAGGVLTFNLPDDERVDDLWQLQGLDIPNPMTVTPSGRVVGTIAQTFTGDGETTTTVTRTT